MIYKYFGSFKANLQTFDIFILFSFYFYKYGIFQGQKLKKN